MDRKEEKWCDPVNNKHTCEGGKKKKKSRSGGKKSKGHYSLI